MTDFDAIRSQFPILRQQVNGHPLIYLDSGATAQKPQSVIDAESKFYETINAGVHRGAHTLAGRSTVAFEEARAQVAKLVGASYEEGNEELVVTMGATDGLNTLATAFGNASLGRGGKSAQRFALKPGDDTADEVITEHTKIVAITHISNVTGAITNIAPIVRRAHEVGALFILDACQSVPHIPVDFHALDVDFAAFSAHKMYGPTGVGFLYGKRELLEALPPAKFGGSMVELAFMDKPAQYMEPPARFEAGTQPVAQVVAAGVAAQWMMSIGMDAIAQHERTITDELLKLADVDGVRILGPANNVDRIGTVAFEVDGVHPHDVGQYIDAQGIAIRVGHHCAQPIHRHFGVFASNRASTGVYNTPQDAQALVEAVQGVRKFFIA